ncbi:MAG: hypothetical protein MJ154_00135 [Candidatus Saccharibacteria bacterium]|nr:hypothetical protein [Candidatus Saccharibacteria bacterium]
MSEKYLGLPDKSGGDGQDWNMDPNAPKSTELAIYAAAGGEEGPAEDTSTETNPAETNGYEDADEVSAADLLVMSGLGRNGEGGNTGGEGNGEGNSEGDVEGNDDNAETGENGEDGESELDRALGNNYTSDIFRAARSIGKPVENAMDIFDWSDEDKQRLLDALANPVETADEGTSEGGNTGAVAGGAEAGTATATTAETGSTGAAAPEAETSDSEEDDDARIAAAIAAAGVAGTVAAAGGNISSEEANRMAEEVAETADNGNEKKRRSPAFKKKVAAVILTLAALAGMAGLGMNNDKNTKEQTTTAIEETTDDQEDGEQNEALRIMDNYDYYNNIEAKPSLNSWMNGSEYVSDLANSGDIEIVRDTEGHLEFANRDDAYRTILTGLFTMNQEQAGSIMGFAREAGLFSAYMDEATVQAGENAIANMTEEEQAAAIAEWQAALANASFDTVIWQGNADNCYIRDKSGDAHIENSSDAEACHCVTDETGTPVLRVTLENGQQMYFKFNLEYSSIEETKDGYIVTFFDENGNEIKVCCQDLDVEGNPVTSTIPDTDPDPTPTPTPEPTPTPDPDPDPDPTPTPTPDPDPTPTPDPDPTPTPSDEKKPFTEEEVTRGLDGLTVTDEDSEVDEGEVTEAPTEVVEGTGGSTVTPEATTPTVAPGDNEQTVGMDPNSMLSGDGSGNTAAEARDNGDVNGAASGKNTQDDLGYTSAEDAATGASDAAGGADEVAARERDAGLADEAASVAGMNDATAGNGFMNGEL